MKESFTYQTIPVDLPNKVIVRKFKAADGEPITLKLYPVGVLAKNLDRTSHTLRRWEAMGYVPKAVFRVKNIRYYTKSQIQLMLYLTLKYDIRQRRDGIGRPMPEGFIEEAHEHMKILIRYTLERKCPQDEYVEKKRGVIKVNGKN